MAKPFKMKYNGASFPFKQVDQPASKSYIEKAIKSLTRKDGSDVSIGIPMKLTDAEKAENLAKHAEKGKNDPEYWKKVKEVTGSENIVYKGKTY